MVGDRCHLGGVDVVLTEPDRAPGPGIHRWAWDRVDGVPDLGPITTGTAERSAPGASGRVADEIDDRAEIRRHPNGAIGLFYVVLFGPSWSAAADGLRALGVEAGEPAPMGSGERSVLRSLADAGPVQVEVIGPEHDDPNRSWALWGTIIETDDIDLTAEVLGDRLRRVKPAMQPGRRIATLDRSAGSSTNIAFMGPVED